MRDLTSLRCALVATLAATVIVMSPLARASTVDAAPPGELIRILEANVGLSGDITKRLAATRQLGILGRKDPLAIVPLVMGRLERPRRQDAPAATLRAALIGLLGEIGPGAEASVPLLAKIVNDPGERFDAVTLQAGLALRRIGTPEALAAVRAHDASVQQRAARSASSNDAARSAAGAAYLIRQQLRRPEPSEEMIAISAEGLGALGARAAGEVATLLRAHRDPRLGKPTVARIARAIREAGVDDIEAAQRRAGAAGHNAGILDEVIAETRHADPFVRGLAMSELGRLRVSPPAIDALIAALGEGRNPGDAARVLGDFGAAAARAVPDIRPYFDDETAGANAIQAVGKIGVRDAATIGALRRILADPAHRHRGRAASAIGQLRAVEALPELRAALAPGRKYDRILAANALARLGAEAAPAVGDLTAMLEDGDLDIRRAAVQALAGIGEAAAPAVPAMTAMLDSGDTCLKSTARQALDQIGGTDADAALARDADRFAEADLAEIRLLATTRGIDGMSDRLFELPEARALSLARRLLSEPGPDAALIGAMYLAYRGEIEPAIPILADDLVRRKDGERWLTGLAYSMQHGGDETQIQPLIEGLRRYFAENRDRYTAEERARFEAVFERGMRK